MFRENRIRLIALRCVPVLLGLALISPIGSSEALATPVTTSTTVSTSGTTSALRSCLGVAGNPTLTCAAPLGTAAIGALVKDTVTDSSVIVTPATSAHVTAVSHAVGGRVVVTITTGAYVVGSTTGNIIFTINPTGTIPSGHAVHFTATVQTSGLTSPLGSVAWYITSTDPTVTGITCSNGTTTKLTKKHLPATETSTVCNIPSGVLIAAGSPYHVRAAFTGTPSNPASTETFTQLVGKLSTKAHISGSPLPSRAHLPVRFTVSITPAPYPHLPTGTVTFSFGKPTAAPLPVCVGGDTKVLTTAQATCVLTAGFGLSGTYEIHVSYAGDANYLTSQTCPVATTAMLPEHCLGFTHSVKTKVH